MITWKEYKKRPATFWVGKKVRNITPMENGRNTFPAGIIFEITDKYGGFALSKVDVCPHCGIGKKFSISRVEPTSLELISKHPESEASDAK